ncbi:hypothetical protein [Alkalihalobacterium chitinilyticum]|uniref:SMODS-associating 2TM beta-strand rich effector domain-containing protein n=1 Tax=Alkalihalobacterium chitinilyticum TaxID=2980103 RepID=A0ABT5VGI6_9BACI|nr:hypothetical protein [Alkalihalobacterium chitinilyticum]MDE5414575.1 hypothetical protein [Alkalihalobacterium chitinilyticum]
MKDKLQSDIFKTLSTAFLAGISYFIADFFQVSTLIFNFSDVKWHVTVSVAIYTAVLNGLLLYALSKRTNVQVVIIERKDRSDKIRIFDKPRATEVRVTVNGNLKKIRNNVEVIFPQWIDVMPKGSPDLKQSENNSHNYLIDLSGIVQNSKSEVSIFYFDITMNPIYEKTGRVGEVLAKVNGSTLRYAKSVENLTVHYSAE